MSSLLAKDMAWEQLEVALRLRRPICLSYHRTQREVCPHALGWKSGRPMLLAYQSGGQTSTGALPADPRKRWRCLFVDEIDEIVTAGQDRVWQSADNYNHSHPFASIDQVALAVTPRGLPPAG
jgi:hypothetical protein